MINKIFIKMKQKLKTYFENKKLLLIFIFIFLLIFETFVFKQFIDLTLYLIIFYWIICVWLNDIKPKWSLIVGLIFFLLTIILLLLGMNIPSEKASNVAYLFIFISVCHYLFTMIREDKRT